MLQEESSGSSNTGKKKRSRMKNPGEALLEEEVSFKQHGRHWGRHQQAVQTYAGGTDRTLSQSLGHLQETLMSHIGDTQEALKNSGRT